MPNGSPDVVRPDEWAKSERTWRVFLFLEPHDPAMLLELGELDAAPFLVPDDARIAELAKGGGRFLLIRGNATGVREVEVA